MNKTTIYGLPLNPMPLLNELAGASFCVSYATRDKLGRQLDQAIDLVGDILLVDNGAFSAHQAGIDTMNDEAYLAGFAAWANDILARCPQAIAVLPDVIGGSELQNAQLARDTVAMFPELRVMPIWHMHESIEHLLWLCEGAGFLWDYIGFGSSGDYWQVGTPKWNARIAEAFAAIDAWEAANDGAYVRPRIHMMRAQSQAHRFAFDSSDSTNVAVNHGRQRRKGEDLVAFAGRVDAKVQASAGPEVDHQAKRPLLGHLAQAAWRAALRVELAVAHHLVASSSRLSLAELGAQVIARANARALPRPELRLAA